MVRLIHTTIQN